MSVAETERLRLGLLDEGDAPFILELLNEPSFIENIGDKGVRTLEDARSYLRTGPLASYEANGFGLFRVDLKSDGSPIGVCGLVQREGLEDVDIGFALLPQFWSRGYATEAAGAVLAYARSEHGLERIVAITSLGNEASGRVLARIGLAFEQILVLGGGEVRLFGSGPES